MHDEEDTVEAFHARIVAALGGLEFELVLVDDGSRDGTGDVASTHGATVARHLINRGGGAALRTGYRLLADSEASIVVTLDADGQHPVDARGGDAAVG